MRSAWNKGKKLSPEHKSKIAATRKGQAPWNKGKIGLMPIPWNKGKQLSEETKKKISESRKGKTPWNKGKGWSPEMKEKFSTLAKERYEQKNNSGDSSVN